MTTSALLQLPETAEPAPAAQLAYGYMRVPGHVPDHKVRHLEQTVIRFARGHGLTFAGFFFEFHCGSREGFDELVAELVRTGAQHVVVPSLRHLALHAQLQAAMCTYLDEIAGAQVLALRHPGARRTEQRRLLAGTGAPA